MEYTMHGVGCTTHVVLRVQHARDWDVLQGACSPATEPVGVVVGGDWKWGPTHASTVSIGRNSASPHSLRTLPHQKEHQLCTPPPLQEQFKVPKCDGSNASCSSDGGGGGGQSRTWFQKKMRKQHLLLF